jgi:hypothetical protein
VFAIGRQNDGGQDQYTIGPDPDRRDWTGLRQNIYSCSQNFQIVDGVPSEKEKLILNF